MTRHGLILSPVYTAPLDLDLYPGSIWIV